MHYCDHCFQAEAEQQFDAPVAKEINHLNQTSAARAMTEMRTHMPS